MSSKYAYPPPKKASGIALRPELWERITRYAKLQGKSKNEVMEDVLELYVPAVQESGKIEANIELAGVNTTHPFNKAGDD